jgi:hypothetical protein
MVEKLANSQINVPLKLKDLGIFLEARRVVKPLGFGVIDGLVK